MPPPPHQGHRSSESGGRSGQQVQQSIPTRYSDGDESNPNTYGDSRLTPSHANLVLAPKTPRTSRKTRGKQTAQDEAPMTAVADENTQLRKLDRETRWMVFLWHSNKFMYKLITTVYTKIDVDDQLYIDTREAIMRNVRSYKSAVCTNMMVCPTLPEGKSFWTT